MQENRSILDKVMEQSARLQNKLGPKDRARVTEYLDNIRELERRIQKSEQQKNQDIAAPATPVGIPVNFADHANLMLDLTTVAYQADLTRVFTFMMARDLHSRAYPELGVPEGHHSLSHHGGDPTKISHFATVNAPHDAALPVPAEDAGHVRRRWLAAGSFVDRDRQRHEHRQRAQPRVPAVCRGWRWRQGRAACRREARDATRTCC
jgi:hypothetical protein